MINYYKKSRDAFIKFIKNNPYVTKKEWDSYAQENCLFSAFTIECHEFSRETFDSLIKQNQDMFEYLKGLFIIVPNKNIKYLTKL